jgi:hypothetical protein
MIESPLIQELLAERVPNPVLRFMAVRFGSVLQEIEAAIHAIQKESPLDQLVDGAANYPDLEAFRTQRSS